MWDTINQERKCSKSERSSIKFIHVNKNVVNDTFEKANQLNTYLSTIAERTLNKPETTPNYAPLDSPDLFPMAIMVPSTTEEQQELSKIING